MRLVFKIKLKKKSLTKEIQPKKAVKTYNANIILLSTCKLAAIRHH
jgi:hypothetical protein